MKWKQRDENTGMTSPIFDLLGSILLICNLQFAEPLAETALEPKFPSAIVILSPLGQALANLFCKGPENKDFRLAGYVVSVATVVFWHCNVKAPKTLHHFQFEH